MAEVTRIQATQSPESVRKAIEDPNIIKLAKLIMIFADKENSIEDRHACLKAASRFGIITEKEAAQLLLYKDDLEAFMEGEA